VLRACGRAVDRLCVRVISPGPGLTRVAVLFDAAVASDQRKWVEAPARRLGVTIAPLSGTVPIRCPLRFGWQRTTARGLIVRSSSNIQTTRNRRLIADATLKRRLPAISLTPLFARHGLPICAGRFDALHPDSGIHYYRVRKKATKSARSCAVRPMPKRSL